MPNVFKALSDPIFRQDVKRGVMDALNRGMVSGGLGAPVDLATMALRPFGYSVEKPVGGSEWIGDKMRRAGMVSDQRNALAEAAAGMLAPTGYADPIATARAVAGLVGAAQVAGPAQKAMFIGAGAKTWDKAAAAKAQALEAQGVDARTIWKETGTFKGADGKWRQEIDDSAAEFNDAGFRTIGGKLTSKDVGLGKQIEHNSLFSAYPKLGKVDAIIDRNSPGAAGGGSGSYGGGLLTAQAGTDKEAMSTSLHEIQHAIQGAEKFSSGGNRNSTPLLKEFVPEIERILSESGYSKTKTGWVNKDGDSIPPWLMRAVEESAAKNLYNRLHGEAEARATEARFPLNAQQRRELFPYDSYDVKPENLIVRLAR